MAVDGFARALAFAAASAEDVSNVQKDMEALETSLETTKTELNATLENTTTELNASLDAAKTEINAELDATTEELNNELDNISNELEIKRVKIFDSNIVNYEALSAEERLGFDIAIAAPVVQLEEAQVMSINTMVGDDTETIMNMSASELNTKLDAIIGGE